LALVDVGSSRSPERRATHLRSTICRTAVWCPRRHDSRLFDRRSRIRGDPQARQKRLGNDRRRRCQHATGQLDSLAFSHCFLAALLNRDCGVVESSRSCSQMRSSLHPSQSSSNKPSSSLWIRCVLRAGPVRHPPLRLSLCSLVPDLISMPFV
jgi:hypothetical protein